jgi:hypothetical protein
MTRPPSMQQRVQRVVLGQIAAHDEVDWHKVAAECPGADQRDLQAALENMLEAGWIEAPSHPPEMLLQMAAGGWLTLTERGRKRLHDENA